MAGLGSLGRLRFVTIAEWNGGQIAREAKVLVPSACAWATGKDDDEPLYDKIVLQSIRCPDPFLTVRKGWLVRRLAPDCSRVELTALPKDRDEYKLPEAPGCWIGLTNTQLNPISPALVKWLFHRQNGPASR